MKMLLAALACATCLAAPALAAEKCTASADSAWAAAGNGVMVEAFASGDSCEKATVVLAIHDETGAIVYTSVGAVDYMVALQGNKTAKELGTALAAWIDQKDSNFKTTADLPEWKAGADMPMAGEFPFYVEAGIDRDSYEKYRAGKSPLFCFVPGIESVACVMKETESGAIMPIGAQAFPG